MTEIGYGLDGCVYKPGFCKTTHKYPERDYISKVMKKGKAKAESEMMLYINLNLLTLDPDMKYFISNPELCELSQSDSFKFEMARKEVECKHIPKPYYAVNYIDGGEDLFVILSGIYTMYENNDYLPLVEWNNLFFGLYNIFEGIELLNKNGIYHMDVKPDNIVYDTSSDPPQFKLIDFGLSRTKANPPTKTIGSFKYTPPEMYMFPSSKLPNTRAQYDYFFNEVNRSGEILLRDKPNIGYYNDLPDEKKYEKADVWALGMTLIDLYNAMVECPKFTDEELEIYSDIEQLAYAMIDPYIHSRITIKNAVIEYRKIITKIDTHFFEMQQAEQAAQMQAKQAQAKQAQAKQAQVEKEDQSQVKPEEQPQVIPARQRNRNITFEEPGAKRFKSINGGKKKTKRNGLKKVKKAKKSKKIKKY
jgi:serine/threonine protein kinase